MGKKVKTIPKAMMLLTIFLTAFLVMGTGELSSRGAPSLKGKIMFVGVDIREGTIIAVDPGDNRTGIIQDNAPSPKNTQYNFVNPANVDINTDPNHVRFVVVIEYIDEVTEDYRAIIL